MYYATYDPILHSQQIIFTGSKLSLRPVTVTSTHRVRDFDRVFAAVVDEEKRRGF